MFSPKKPQTTYFCHQVKNPTTNCNPLTMKKWIFYLLIAGFFLLVLVPAIIMALYSIGDKGTIYINTKLEIGDALGFYAALLSAVGSVTLGCVAIWQTHKANQMTETALSLQKSEQISVLVPQSCFFRFYGVPSSRKGQEMGAQLSLVQKNQSSNLIVDYQIESLEFLVCNPQNEFLICNKEDKQSAFVKVGVCFSINNNIIDSSCNSEVDFFIPERNITDKLLRPDQIFPQSMRHPPGRAVLLLGEYPQQIAVVEVEGAKPRHLFSLFQIPVEPALKRLRPVFPLGATLG